MRLINAEFSRIGRITATRVNLYALSSQSLGRTRPCQSRWVPTMQMVAGAAGAFKNPSSHRTVAYDGALQDVHLWLVLMVRYLWSRAGKDLFDDIRNEGFRV